MAPFRRFLVLTAFMVGVRACAPASGQAPTPATQEPIISVAQHVEPLPPPRAPSAAVEPVEPLEQLVVGVTLSELEQMALANNPAIAVAHSRVAAAEGNWVQVGLRMNPTIGYIGDDIGIDGSAGGQGGYIQQQFVTGHKLQLNREVAAQQVAAAQAQAHAATLRALTDVRTQFYRTLLAQRRVEVTNTLTKLSQEAADTAKLRWQKALTGLRVDYVRARIEADRMRIALAQAEARHAAALRELANVVGVTELPERTLAGNLQLHAPALNYQASLAQVMTTHPLIAAAQAQVDRAGWSIRRAEAQAIPNLQTYMELKHDTVNDDTLVLVQAGVNLPIFNRNQGGVQQANGNYAAAVSALRQTELRLQQQLAGGFRDYDAAQARVKRYAEDILPSSKTTVTLAEGGLAGGELTYLDLLTARRAYYQAHLDYLNALEDLWVAAQRIEGMMLEGSLQGP